MVVPAGDTFLLKIDNLSDLASRTKRHEHVHTLYGDCAGVAMSIEQYHVIMALAGFGLGRHLTASRFETPIFNLLNQIWTIKYAAGRLDMPVFVLRWLLESAGLVMENGEVK
jgi:hypothetical protein